MQLSEYVWHKILRRPYRLRKIIDQGKGDNIVILIHGLGAKAQQWQPLAKILDKNKYRVVAYDLLGFGESPKPRFLEYSVEEHTNSLLKTIKKDLPKDACLIIVAHSMGCIISTNLAFNNPGLIDKLILYEPPILASTGRKILIRKSFYKYVAGRPALVSSYLRMAGRFTDKFSSFKTSNATDEQWLPFEKSLRNTILDQETVNELKHIDIDTHVVYGRFDFVVSKIDAKKMAAINPRVKLHYVTEIHDITIKSAKFLKNIIESV